MSCVEAQGRTDHAVSGASELEFLLSQLALALCQLLLQVVSPPPQLLYICLLLTAVAAVAFRRHLSFRAVAVCPLLSHTTFQCKGALSSKRYF